MGRRTVSLSIALSLIMIGCGGSSDDAAAPASSAPAPASSAPASSAPTSVSVTTEPVTTDSVTLPAAAETPPLVPEVVCLDHDLRVWFGYDNQSSSVVVVGGDGNRLQSADPDDEPFVPTLFAPGRVSPAFVALPGPTVADPRDVTWELTGPDGVVRTAHVDDDTPACDDEPLLRINDGDARTPVLEVRNAAVSAAGEITLDFVLTGVPELSVCNAAFDAEPVVIRFEDGNDQVLAEGPSLLAVTAPVVDYRSIGPAAPYDLSVVVIDRCSYDGTTFSSWPTGAFEALLLGEVVCVSVPDGSDPEIVDETCSDLGLTGGSMIRNG